MKKICYSRRGVCMAQTITQETECLNFKRAKGNQYYQVCANRRDDGKCRKMKERVMDGVFLLIVIACVFGLLVSWNDGQRRKNDNSWSLSKAERKLIMEELDKRGAGYCVLEPIPSGWKCTDQQGKIFVVRK